MDDVPHVNVSNNRRLEADQRKLCLHSNRKKDEIFARPAQNRSDERCIFVGCEQDSTRGGTNMLEAKKQINSRHQRLFSHYRKYEQWRRRQFSCDFNYKRPKPFLTPQTSLAAGQSVQRSHQYRHQFSCVEHIRHDSQNSLLTRNDLSTARRDDPVYTDTIPNGEEKHASHFQTVHEAYSASISERCSRSRINSAIFVSSEGIGFDSVEFFRRHGSQSLLCRRAKSAENVGENETEKQQFVHKSQQSVDENGELRNEVRNGKNFCEVELQEYIPNESYTTRNLSARKARKKREDHEIQDSGFVVTNLAKVASDFVVGSVSIERPTSYSKQSSLSSSDTSRDQKPEKQTHATLKDLRTCATVSCDSSDTVEEFVVVAQKSKSEEHQSLLPAIKRNRTSQISTDDSTCSLNAKASNATPDLISKVSVPEQSSQSPSASPEDMEECECL